MYVVVIHGHIFISECSQSTYLFDSRCYSSCPKHAYLVPESVATQVDGNGTVKVLTVRQLQDSASADQPSIELSDDSHSYDIIPQERAIRHKVPQKICRMCHVSCSKCRGATESDCTECETSYERFVINKDQMKCQKSVKIEPNLYLTSRQIYLYGFIIALLLIAFIIISYYLFTKCMNNKKDYQYDKILMEESIEHDVMMMKHSGLHPGSSVRQVVMSDIINDLDDLSSGSDLDSE